MKLLTERDSLSSTRQFFMDPLIISNSMLLKIAKGQRTYKARFVIDVSELGEFSPLLQNKIEIPYGTLDIIALDAILFQDHSSVCANDQIQWLTRILKESDSEWKVVFGECKILKMENGSPFEPLWSILLQYGENAYISTKSCADQGQRFGVSSMDRGSYFTAVNQNFVFKE
ncbi:calcineurin-like metallo-phosphoesterase super family protein [Striga asiatica]|uniref:Calcineurin-like metallo-phosphoesterase super family protein n=1 Tax=Striga asiatica TaxID=4170 RepID=A0A5A7P2I6_STRAF|nr:calcineurin-like metallo-phosphoesterase super family protein [Striga asiatica]